MLTLRLGWRNLWRNGRRTSITLAAVAFNTVILIVTYALMDGLMAQMVSNATNLVTGEVEIHAREYLADRSFYRTIERPQELLDAAGRLGVPAAPRSFGFGLVSQGTKSAGAMFWGVDPAAEIGAFDLHKHLAQGKFLPAASDRPAPETGRPLVLGAKLARSLNASIGSEIVAVVQAADGSLGNEIFTVTGILKTAGEGLDRSAALITRQDFGELFVAPDAIHEIAFNTRERMPPETLAARIGESAAGQDLRTWRQLLPQLAFMVDMYDVSIWIFGAIFFLAAGLGVLNTMLMSTFERIREFGVQKALGTSPWRIVTGVAWEALLLAAVASVIGAAIAVPISYALQAYGLDMSSLFGSFTAVGVAFDPVWYSRVSPHVVLTPVLVMWAVALLAALWPAIKAARIQPVRAMTHV